MALTGSNLNRMFNIHSQHGAIVNDKDEDSMRPLHTAAMRGNLSATRQLLKWPGIDIEVSSIYCTLTFRVYNSKFVRDT